MNSNKFELVGKVNFVDNKYSDKGTYLVKILLGVYLGKDKQGESVYDSFNITLFSDTAEQFSETIKKGDYVYLSGRLNVNKYTSKEGKEVKDVQLIANEFNPVEYDKDSKEYVIRNVAAQTELPWKKK